MIPYLFFLQNRLFLEEAEDILLVGYIYSH